MTRDLQTLRLQAQYNWNIRQIQFMAKICDLCQRKPRVGNSRSHSNIATKRRLMINLQTRRIDGQRLLVCTSCLSRWKKTKQEAAAALVKA